MTYVASALSPRFLLVLLAIFAMLLLIVILFQGFAHAGSMPFLAQSSMAVVN